MKINKHNFKKDAKDSNETKEQKVKLIPYTMNRDNLRVKSKAYPYGINMIDAPNMWKASYRGQGIKVAIIDTGCDVNHVSLKDNIAGVRNFTPEDNKDPNVVIDRVGHGTHVAGIVAANGKVDSVIGAAPEAELYILKALDRTGSGKSSWVINAVNYAVDLKVDVISMSLGNIAAYAMWMRRYMVDEMNSDYVKLARAKGVSEKNIMVHHVLRNAFVPMAQYLPASILYTIAGSIYIESLYSIPGMGGLLVEAIQRQDNPLVQGLVIIYSSLGILGLVLGDIAMSITDPRIKLQRNGGGR